MKLLNKTNIPESLFLALSADWYGGKNEERDFSITELLKPAREVILCKRHYDEIEVDAETQFWSMLGSAMHMVIAKASENTNNLYLLIEKRFSTYIEQFKISGGLDLYDKKTETIIDYKFQTVFNWIYLEEKIKDLTTQLNGYKYLLERNGYGVKHLQVIFIFRDFREWEKTRFNNYPNKIFEVLNIDVMESSEIENILRYKIYAIDNYNDIEDDLLPICSPEERWQKGEIKEEYHVKLKGRRIATFDTYQEAQFYIEKTQYKGCSIERKVNLPKKCQTYCQARNFCNFYIENVKPYIKEQNEDSE